MGPAIVVRVDFESRLFSVAEAGYAFRMKWTLSALLFATISGCHLGDGTGAVAGTLYVRNCTTDSDFGSAGAPVPFDLHPTFFVADLIDDFAREHPMNRVQIRVQSTGLRVEGADVFYVDVASTYDVAIALGQALQITLSSNVRASLVLNTTCPDAEVEIGLAGTLTFTQFGSAGTGPIPNDFRLSFGDPIAAAFSLDIVDRRAIALGGQSTVPLQPAVGGHLDGNFAFVIRQGLTAQAYP
jgi:hypothetical protein